MPHCRKTNPARTVATLLTLPLAAACLSGMASASDWTHDAADGAVTVVALPGGQATLARDGADRQARTIAYVSADGVASTIARAYGPSGRKAVETENGTLRQHVYGTGLAPLLRVEGDGSLSYQAGMDTIGVDTAGNATVAHRVADIKRSTAAVLDVQGQARQQVAYGTLGQASYRQTSADAYAAAAQLSGYEALSAWQLGPDQLIDNRARLYAPAAGRFLALDAAGQALGYEARGNNWITHADRDGNMEELLDVLQADRNLVATFLIPEDEDEDADQVLFARQFLGITEKLKKGKIPFSIASDVLVTENRAYSEEYNIGRLFKKEWVRQLVKDDVLTFVGSDTLVNYGGNKIYGANSEKVKLLFITRKTFDDYMEGRDSTKNFFFISTQQTKLKFLAEKHWENKKNVELRNLEQTGSEDAFIDWGNTRIDIYTRSDIYGEHPALAKLRPGQKQMEELANLTKEQKLQRLKDFQQSYADEAKNNEENNALLKQENISANKKHKEQEEPEEEGSKADQMQHGSCKACLVQ